MTKKPSYRFVGFEDEWKEVKLGEILVERNEQISENEEYQLMSFVQGKGVVPKSDRYDRSFLVKDDKKNYKKTEFGDFIYSSNNLDTGSIGFNKSGKALISPVYSIFYSRTKKESQFIAILSQRKEFINEMIKYRQGVVYGQFRIHESDFLNISILAPESNAQEALINFFQDIDQLLNLQQRKLEVLKEQKKTYLKLLFPAKGQIKPALRFAGFEDDWKEVKLGEVLTERNIQMVPSDQVPLVSFTVENGVTPKTERYNREFLVREESKKYKYTRYNDIVYNPANLKFGAIARNKYGEAVFSPIYVTFEVNYSNILPEFIEGILTSKDFIQQALKFQEGTVYERMAVKADDFTRLAITVPSLPEQEVIGSFFQDLDKSIAKQEEKVNQLKESKQTLLRKMFI